MLKKITAWGLFVVWGVASLAAQSNDRLDELLAQAPAKLDATAYLLMTAAKLVSEDVAPSAAFEVAASGGFLPPGKHPDDGVSVEDLSYFIMKTQKIPGGVEWMFLPSPRAAYRELAFRDVINSSAGPLRLVAGDEVMRILTGAKALVSGGVQ